MSKTVKELEALAVRYEKALKAALAKGSTPRQAATYAFEKVGWMKQTVNIIGSGRVAAVEVAGVSAEASFIRSSQLGKVFEGVSLSERIVDGGIKANAEVSATIKRVLDDGKAWNKLALEIRRTDLIGSDPTARIGELADAARAAYGGADPVAVKKYASELAKMKAHVSRLKDSNAPTGDLRRAYQKVLDATEKGSQKAIDLAIENAVKKKMAYNAQRIARTEMVKAWGEEKMAEFEADPDVVAVRWERSSVGSDCPACTELAERDKGYGPGIYLLGEVPEYPNHPNDMCILTPVYSDEIELKK